MLWDTFNNNLSRPVEKRTSNHTLSYTNKKKSYLNVTFAPIDHVTTTSLPWIHSLTTSIHSLTPGLECCREMFESRSFCHVYSCLGFRNAKRNWNWPRLPYRSRRYSGFQCECLRPSTKNKLRYRTLHQTRHTNK